MSKNKKTQRLALAAFFIVPIFISLAAWQIADIALPETDAVRAERNAVSALFVAELEADPRAVEMLGTPITSIPGANYPIYNLEGVRHAAIATEVLGPKARGPVVGMAIIKNGKWHLLRLTLEIPATGRRISLGSSP